MLPKGIFETELGQTEPISVTYIGAGGPGATGASTAATPSYNQTAGHLIVAVTKAGVAGSQYCTSLTDTAGNTYVRIFTTNCSGQGTDSGTYVNPTGKGGGATDIDCLQMWYCANCVGNASNVLTATFNTNVTYSGVAAWDVTGADTLDTASVSMNQFNTATGTSYNIDLTTTQENEVVLVYGQSNYGGSGTYSAGSGFTLNGAWPNQSGACAYKIQDAVRSSERITPLTSTNSTTWSVMCVGFYKGGRPSLFPAPVSVDLSSSFNRMGMITDGSTFSSSSGIDGIGGAISTTLLGTGLGAFAFGSSGVNNVVICSGQTITLTSGKYTTLLMLATAVFGAKTGIVFQVNYGDSSNSQFTQSISDWGVMGNYSEENYLSVHSHRNMSDGSTQSGTWLLPVYAFALDPAKTVASITLPNNGNVIVVALALVP